MTEGQGPGRRPQKGKVCGCRHREDSPTTSLNYGVGGLGTMSNTVSNIEETCMIKKSHRPVRTCGSFGKTTRRYL